MCTIKHALAWMGLVRLTRKLAWEKLLYISIVTVIIININIINVTVIIIIYINIINVIIIITILILNFTGL